MRAALALRGHPEERFPALHVAGTNGKGSTAAMVEAVLRAAGRRTGLYTSPHLVDFTERIRAGGRAIPRTAVAELTTELRAALGAGGVALTYFEFTTLMALEWFARIGVDAAVVEVGLGGRLDATNLVVPAATAITSIAHDHEEYLGSDLAAIAREKAGILKAGIPLALGPVPAEAEASIADRARELGAPVTRVGVDAGLEERPRGLHYRGPGGTVWDGLQVALPGSFQRANAAVALTVLALVRQQLPCSVEAVRAGLGGVVWPGRLATLCRRPLVVADGAHNPAGVEALVRELPTVAGNRRAVLVFAVMADKAWRRMLEPLRPQIDTMIVTRVGRRGLDPAAVVDALAGGVRARAIADPRVAIREALATAGPAGVVLVTGSLFLVGEAYAELGGSGTGLFAPWQGWEGDGTEPPP
jgi:dihydrofolate synthase/folylpolyglutamate synthase